MIGDGDIPLRRICAALADAGYDGWYDIELLGPAIEAEGYESVVPRADCALPRAVGLKRAAPQSHTQADRGETHMKLKDKVAIITGAGQGIGEAYARRFAQEGATVVVADINAEKGEAVAAAIGGGAVFERVDVSSEDGHQAARQGGRRPLRPHRRAAQQRRDLLRHRQLQLDASRTCARSST